MQNITLQDLRDYRHIQAEIDALDTVAQEYREKIAGILQSEPVYRHTSSECGVKLSEANNCVKDLQKITDAYREVERNTTEKRLKLSMKKIHIERFLLSIGDPELRKMFALRFLYGFKWHEIVPEIGGHATEDSIKKKVYRYIKKAGRFD